MDSRGFGRFVGDMIPTRAKWLERKAQEDTRRREEEEEEQERLRREREEAARRDEEERRSAAASEQGAPLHGRAASDQPPISSPSRQTGDAGIPRDDAKSDARPKREAGLAADVPQYIEEHEARFIEHLHPFIDRPRLAKRFVNIYKLLRVTADDEGRGAEFARQAEAEPYRAVLVLLAIHIGHHRASIPLVHAISRAGKDETLSQVLERLATGSDDHVTREAVQDLAHVRAKLARLTADGVAVPERLTAYRDWGPHVLRYSFEPLRPSSALPDVARAHPRR
jgi:hypothetical protein